LRTAESLADFWINRLLGRAMSESDRAATIAVMAQEYGAQDTLPDDHVQYVLPAMVEVILMSPDFQWK
jgi:isoprenylcysteine carboxyl methyltransferase (ICMT) family protein YpbQ